MTLPQEELREFLLNKANQYAKKALSTMTQLVYHMGSVPIKTLK